MKITIDLEKTFEENAAAYFDKAKKARAKLEGAKVAYATMEKKASETAEHAARVEEETSRKPPEKKWYHKYRWSMTRNGHLLVGGQNAAANETLVKNHTSAEDTVLHTDMAGSPFVILKPSGEVTEDDLLDAATLTACYSRAWQTGISSLEVFHVKPDQVTKEANAGESLPRGAFMIRGETKYLHPKTELSIGVIEREGYVPEVFVGSREACEVHCSKFSTIIPGSDKTSDVAKQLQKRFGGILDAFVKAIPSGGSRILKK